MKSPSQLPVNSQPATSDCRRQAHLQVETFRPIAQKIQSHFFTIDVARRRDGTWNIIEIGDGQVAGLLVLADVEAFYRVPAKEG